MAPFNPSSTHASTQNCTNHTSANTALPDMQIAAVASPQTTPLPPPPAAGDTSSDQPISGGAMAAIIIVVLLLFAGLGACAWKMLYRSPEKKRRSNKAAKKKMPQIQMQNQEGSSRATRESDAV